MSCQKLIVFHLGSHKINISKIINVNLASGTHTYKLNGMIYFGDFHFTSQFVDKSDNIWYHDGIETVNSCKFQGLLHNLTNDALLSAYNKQLCTVIYSFQ